MNREDAASAGTGETDLAAVTTQMPTLLPGTQLQKIKVGEVTPLAAPTVQHAELLGPMTDEE